LRRNHKGFKKKSLRGSPRGEKEEKDNETWEVDR
jgi:hypothetical protein